MPTKFLEAIDARDTGRMKYGDTIPGLELLEGTEQVFHPTVLHMYRFEVRFGYNAAVKDLDDLPRIKHRIANAVAQEVYGEVINQLIKVDLAILDHDMSRAYTELMKAMELMRARP